MLITPGAEADASANEELRPKTSLAKPSLIDRFADHLADGLSVEEAASSLGLPTVNGRAMLSRIRKRLGSQAI